MGLYAEQFGTRHPRYAASGIMGKTHFLCALGRELVLQRGYAVYFTPTFKLVQQLLAAKKDLRLEAALKKLDRFEAVILD